jgi:predicted DNA-binding protein with PD1-like motif
MKAGDHDDVVYGTFEAGRDLRTAYADLMEERGFEAGIVLTGIGMLEDPTLGFFQGEGEYDRHTLEGAYELLTTQGNLATSDGEPFPHLHVTLGGEDHAVQGGHLFEGTVAVGHEFAVRVLPDGALTRSHDPGTGLQALRPR